jgi:hypothetical protein
VNAFRRGATVSLRMLACGLCGLVGLSAAATETETGSLRYRLVGPAPASTASLSASPLQRLRWIGGSGQPVGMAASPNASTNSGGASLQLPTHRIFRDGLED